VAGAVGIAEHDSAVVGAAGIAVPDSAMLGGGGITEHDSLVVGAAGIAVPDSAMLGGGGIAVPDSAMLGGGGTTGRERTSSSASPAVTDPILPGSIPLMLRPAPRPHKSSLVPPRQRGQKRHQTAVPHMSPASSEVHITTRVRSPRNKSRANSSGSPDRA